MTICMPTLFSLFSLPPLLLLSSFHSRRSVKSSSLFILCLHSGSMFTIDLLWPSVATVIVAAGLAVVCGTKKKKEDKASKPTGTASSVVASAAPVRPVAKSVEGKSRSGSGSTSTAQFGEAALAKAAALGGSPARDATPSPDNREAAVAVVAARPPVAAARPISPEKPETPHEADLPLPPLRRPRERPVAPKEPPKRSYERDRDYERIRDRDRNPRAAGRLDHDANRNRKFKNKLAVESMVEVKRDPTHVYKGEKGEAMRAPCNDETLGMCETGGAFGPADSAAADKAKEAGEAPKIPQSDDQSGPDAGSNPGSDPEPQDKREDSYKERKKERDRKNKKKSSHKKKSRSKDRGKKGGKKHRTTSTTDSEEEERRRKRSEREEPDGDRRDDDRRRDDKRNPEDSNPTPE